METILGRFCYFVFLSFKNTARYSAYPPAMIAIKSPETISRRGVMAASLAKALNPLNTLWVMIQGSRLFVL